jgi:peroxiredoxin
MHRILLFFFIFILFIRCNDNHHNLFSLKLKSTDEKNFNFSDIQNNKATVIIFLSPDCPLCQNYSLILNELNDRYGPSKIKMIGIFSGNNYTEENIKEFMTHYKILFSCLLDNDYALTKILNAEITPQVFIIDPKGIILYEGAIDNWAIEPGKKRSIITEKYLESALDSIANDHPFSVKKTKAIGCFIQ